MSKEDAVRKGQAAQALLESADFNIAVDTVRLEAFKGWASSEPSEAPKREEYYYLLQATDKLKDNLKALVSNAQFEIKKAEKHQAEAIAKDGNTTQGESNDET